MEEAKNVLKRADAIFLTSGAGMSVDSGLPDYRSNLGIIAELHGKGYNYDEMCNPQMFIENIEFAWGWYADHMKQFMSKEPHEGYHMIKKYIDKRKLDYFIFTSNVDCMWKKAGFDVNRIMEYHGSMDYLQGLTKKGPIWKTDYSVIESIKYDPDTFICKRNSIPTSPYDGKYARPNVCLFEDCDYFNTSRFEKIDKIFGEWYMNIAKKNKRLVVVEIGAGTIVPTVRNMSEEMVTDHFIRLQRENPEFAKLIRINPMEDTVPPGHISIKMNGLSAIKRLFYYTH